MNTLQVGFSRVNITPPLGIGIAGSFRKRFAEGVLDETEANCICLACGESRVVMISVDLVGLKRPLQDRLRNDIEKATGIPADCVYIHCTHIHTGPFMKEEPETELEALYHKQFFSKVKDSAVLALQDMQPAKMGYAVSQAKNIAYIRRYLTRSGDAKTNPTPGDPDIVDHAGQVDDRVNVLRFDRETDTVILANFGNHPDTLGGKKICSDWPGLLRKYTEQAIPGVKCLFFNGAQGDVNHENFFRKDWEIAGGYNPNIRHRIARVLTGSILQVYDNMHYVEVDTLKCIRRDVLAPTNRPRPEQVPEARRLTEMRAAGMKLQEIFPDVEGMMRTTLLAEAGRIVRLENAPEHFRLPLTAIALGPVAFIGIPGEPFTNIGLCLKEAEDWELVLPTCLTNGSEGYFPTKDAFLSGGYESRTSNFKAGVAELIAEEGRKLLADLAK